MNAATASGARCHRCGQRLAWTRGEAWCLACGVRAMRAVALRVGRLDQERAGLLEELGKLAAVAGFCEVEVPEEVAGLLPARKGSAKGSAGGAFACTWCPRTFGTFVAQRVHETKAHGAGNRG